MFLLLIFLCHDTTGTFYFENVKPADKTAPTIGFLQEKSVDNTVNKQGFLIFYR